MWQLRYAPPAVAGLYRIPRGIAALVTEAIRRLATNPHPFNAEPIPERANMYRIEVEDYSVVYEVLAEQKIVIILRIE
jgi:mRNA-degrading endonuclease RelE of RelBE toxin-antitoxin system